jgi:hypothetical protein
VSRIAWTALADLRSPPPLLSQHHCQLQLTFIAAAPSSNDDGAAAINLKSRRSGAVLEYRGFIRKGDRVHIITFRDTTRIQSQSNRCI